MHLLYLMVDRTLVIKTLANFEIVNKQVEFGWTPSWTLNESTNVDHIRATVTST